MRTAKASSWRSSCFAALSLIACGSASEPGVRVELVSAQSLLAGHELDAAAGRVMLQEVFWTSAEVELNPCLSAVSSAKAWLISEAHAHGTSSPTRVAVPTVVNAAADGQVAIGELTPPAGRYCSVRYRLGPADADAVGLSVMPDMQGLSFLLRGALSPASGTPENFELRSERVFDMTWDIDLALTSDHRSARLSFECDPELWFQALGADALTGPSRELAILEAFRSSFNVSVQ